METIDKILESVKGNVEEKDKDRLKKLIDVPDQRMPEDTRTFWIQSLAELPILNGRFNQILDLAEASADRMYPGFVCEKLYYACSSERLHPFIDDIFKLGHTSVELGYKPESVLYWLRVAVESEKIQDSDLESVLKLGKTAQEKKLKPEFIYYELWGLTNYDVFGKDEISKVVDITQRSMEQDLDPYDVLHWLRINTEIDSNGILQETLYKLENKENPIRYLADRGISYLRENPGSITKVADKIVEIHIP
jgi:hypothetical protein